MYLIGNGASASLASHMAADLANAQTRTKKNNEPSTNAKTQERLKGRHPIIEDIMFFKKMNKHKSTYADPYSAFVRSDGRIHPSLNLDGARANHSQNSASGG